VLKFADFKLIKSVKDVERANRLTTRAWQVIAHHADDAFATAVDISGRIGTTFDEYARLSDAIATLKVGQKLIMGGGRVWKY